MDGSAWRWGKEMVRRLLIGKGGGATMGYDDDDDDGVLGFRLGWCCFSGGYVDRFWLLEKEIGDMVIDCDKK
ncbi:hypothetical protein QVD17_15677 [Tagetes erecta]|uniref:Uncharacterized protein n=1 Tax=Tagetes erecta TaxID=13708 RepID=A0AAD8NZW4_TARER|nr:hypothetical protein QVD17_15676 [Tagetes erecta]KAK1426995.1 hypothetical protein QVD17_15677 [Tagetes erecta]